MSNEQNAPTAPDYPSIFASIFKANDVRGLVDGQLDDDVVAAVAAAYAAFVREADGASSIVVGHDMRESSPVLARTFAQAAAAQGSDVVLVGFCSTDALYYASGSLDLPGVMFTASHNPAGWNGMKLCRSGARPVGMDSGLAAVRDDALARLQAGAPAPSATPGTIVERDILADYAAHLRGLVPLSGRRLKVVVDAGNGMAGMTTPAVLGGAAGLPELPLDVVPLYFELDGTFPNHEANPLDPKNLLDLQAAVPAHGADLGLAFDGDADRCFVVDERGAVVTPSAVTALVASREIAKEQAAGRPGTVIHNCITSRVVPEVIAEAGGQAVRTRVGHAFIKVEMAARDAVFGGEHSAHYYFRDFWFADTGMLAALHVLAALSEQDQPLSQLASSFERYVASGEINSRVADVEASVTGVEAVYAGRPGIEIDRLDGLTVSHAAAEDGPMWWFNLRASQTEPLLRLNAEAADEATMARVRDEVLALVRG
ncbi:MAG: phosphomannomutase/phosphoglucomutase [Kineosporiaceae bacterium]